MIKHTSWPLVLASIFVLPGSSIAQSEFVFGVNEGVTYRITPHETRARYKELGELLGRVLRERVKIVPEDDYVRLRANLEAKRYDLAYIHPAHHWYRAIRDQGYQLVVLAQAWDQYAAGLLTTTD